MCFSNCFPFDIQNLPNRPKKSNLLWLATNYRDDLDHTKTLIISNDEKKKNKLLLLKPDEQPGQFILFATSPAFLEAFL